MIRILFVDDEPKLQLIIRQLFRHEIQYGDIDIHFALNGLEALDKLKAEPETDIVITDINMPEMDGLTLLSELQTLKPSFNPALTAIVFSAYGDMTNIRKAMNAGAFDFLTKPMEFQDVKITIAKASEHVRQIRNSLERERLVKEALRKANKELERRVKERTSELLKANKALQESQKSLEHAQQIAHIGSWEMDIVSRKIILSREIYRIFGIEPEMTQDEIDAVIEGAVHPDDRDILWEAHEKLLTQGKNTSAESRIIRPDGKVRYIRSESGIFSDEAGKPVRMVGIIQDITRRRQNEEKLKMYAQELEDAKERAEDANQAKSEFLANMSHEIRTPMNAVLGFAQLLSPLITDKTQKTYIEGIRSGGKTLLTLINDILDLSKIEAGNMELHHEPVNPHSIFEELRHVFSPRISEKGLHFIIEMAKDIPNSLLLDVVKIRQILYNLFSNAVKFTEKGHIKISVQNIPATNNKNCVDVIISVEDTGIGIPQESQEIIFESFRQQDGQSTRQFGGTGLGLAISKHLVEMMGGTISMTSQPGKGSCFEIRLHDVPVSETDPESETVHHSDHENIFYEKASVLIADDIENNRILVKEFLRDTNISYTEAENGQKAVAIAEQTAPDIILMDIRMPVMDGYEAIRQIKKNEKLKKIPVIALTASALTEDRKKIMETGFDGHLLKPLQRSELLCELSRFLEYSQEEFIESEPEKLYKQTEVEEISSESLKNLPEVIHQLENEFMKLWEMTRTNEFFDEIEAFGCQMRELGEHCSLEILQQFGENLIDQTVSFDIDNMNLTLDSYPELLEKIKLIEKTDSDENPPKT